MPDSLQPVATGTHYQRAFLAAFGTVQQGNVEVSDEWRWFTEGELEDPVYGIHEHVKHYAREALRAVRGRIK